MILGEAQLVLAEKRTSLSVLRTGIAVIVLPMTILSFLIATSKSYVAGEVIHWLIPLLALSSLLAAIGLYLVVRAILRIRHFDRTLAALKAQNRELAQLLD